MIVLPKLKDLVREQARFVKYENGNLWYQIIWTEYDDLGRVVRPHIFDFPIDVRGDDTGGTFGSSERGITFMRWIRKHLELAESVVQFIRPKDDGEEA